jgi:hypothetical protein
MLVRHVRLGEDPPFAKDAKDGPPAGSKTRWTVVSELGRLEIGSAAVRKGTAKGEEKADSSLRSE